MGVNSLFAIHIYTYILSSLKRINKIVLIFRIMQSGEAVAHKIWNGSIFIAFRLADNERLGDGSNPPPPFYVNAVFYFLFPLWISS